jgi:hypothetical protein
LTLKTTRLIKRSTISIKLTVHIEDKAVGMAADDTISMKEAIIAMATIAAITTTVAQTREAYKEATVEEVNKGIKAFNRRNAMFVTN